MSGGGARIERVVTSGSFNLDGGSWQVDNNVWLVGDDEEVVVIDASHDAAAIREAVGPRRVVAVVCTHGHDDHINAVGDLWDATKAPVWLHPADRMLWAELYEPAPDEDLVDGADIAVAGHVLTALHSPGHSPGSTCLYAPSLNAVFSGDTLFAGGWGRVDLPGGDPIAMAASLARLSGLEDAVAVHPGHGSSTTIGRERAWLELVRDGGRLFA